MNFSELLRVVFQALKTNKTRALLTMLGIIIGVASVVLLLAIGSGLKDFVARQFQALGSNLVYVLPGKLEFTSPSLAQEATFFKLKFTSADVKELEKEVENQEAVVPLQRNVGTIKARSEEKEVLIIGTTSEYSEVRNTKAAEGRFFGKHEEQTGKKVVVLGAKIAQDLFPSDSPLEREVTINSLRFRVIGVAEKKGQGTGIGFNLDELVYIPLSTSQRLFDEEKYNALLIQAKKGKIEEVKKEVEKILGERLDEDEFSVADQKELITIIGNILSVFSVALGGIAAISLLVGGIGIMNIMLISVTERTREIGLRKAVGATPRVIMLQFLLESTILSLSGGLLGLLLGEIGTFFLNHFFPATVTYWSVFLAFFVSVFVGIIFGVGPATKAARLNPIEALRYE